MSEDQSYNTYVLGGYVIAYDPSIRAKQDECNDYHGISFYIGDFIYTLTNNHTLGERIFINNIRTLSCSDIPFRVETFGLLPDKITARKIK